MTLSCRIKTALIPKTESALFLYGTKWLRFFQISECSVVQKMTIELRGKSAIFLT